MKEIYQILLELRSIKIRWGIQIIKIALSGQNYQPFRSYRVRKPKSIYITNGKPLLQRDKYVLGSKLRMELQDNGLYVNLSSEIHMTLDIKGPTPVCIF